MRALVGEEGSEPRSAPAQFDRVDDQVAAADQGDQPWFGRESEQEPGRGRDDGDMEGEDFGRALALDHRVGLEQEIREAVGEEQGDGGLSHCVP